MYCCRKCQPQSKKPQRVPNAKEVRKKTVRNAIFPTLTNLDVPRLMVVTRNNLKVLKVRDQEKSSGYNLKTSFCNEW